MTQADCSGDGAFWFRNLAAGAYTVRELLPDGEQRYPGAPGYEHQVTIDPPNNVRANGRYGVAESPNFGNSLWAVTIVKTADRITVDAEGQVIHYTIAVDNPGSRALTGVMVTDEVENYAIRTLALSSGDADGDGELDPDETWIYEDSHTVTQADLDGDGGGDGKIDNVATVVTDQTPPESSSTSVRVDASTGIAIDKVFVSNADEDASGSVTLGDTLTYELRVVNTGNVTLANVRIVDSLTGTDETVPTLPPGPLMPPISATYVVRQSDIDDPDGQIDNTATVTATPANGTPAVSHQDTEHVPVDAPTGIAIDKVFVSNADEDGSGSVTKGDTITYELRVTNTGNVTLENVRIVDDLTGTDMTVATLPPSPLTPAISATYVVQQSDIDDPDGQVDNTATVTATPANGTPEVSHQDTEHVPVDAFTGIAIDKVFVSNADEDGSGSVTRGDTITYELRVSNTGNVTLENVRIVDDLTGTDMTVATLPPGPLTPAVSATYVVRQSDMDDPDGQIDNTATVTGSPANETPDVSHEDTEHVPVDANVSHVIQFIAPMNLFRPEYAEVGYSPFVRPADFPVDPAKDPWENWLTYWEGDKEAGLKELLGELKAWQSFTISNPADDPISVDIQPNIDDPVKEMVSIYLDRDLDSVNDDLERIEWNQFPINLASGGHDFYVFYRPQAPDWYDNPATPADERLAAPHTFGRDDNLDVFIDGVQTRSLQLVGGSTFDSDITYDGVVDIEDARRLDDSLGALGGLLNQEWPIKPGSSLWDPTSDVNTRYSNGAQEMPQIALGDLGPIEVEFDQGRAPFLDLDWDNGSGVSGVDYATAFAVGGEPVVIVDPADARFANSFALLLESIEITIQNFADGDVLQATADGTDIRVEFDGNKLTLSARNESQPETIESYLPVLRTVEYSSSSPSPSQEPRKISFVTKGSDESFTYCHLPDGCEPNQAIDQTVGNIAVSTVFISYLSGVPSADVAVQGEAEASSATWQNPSNPLDVNGKDGVTPLDALVIVNYMNRNPGRAPLLSIQASPEFFYDVNGDGSCTPRDVLLVINYLNDLPGASAEGEEEGQSETLLSGHSAVNVCVVASDRQSAGEVLAASRVGMPESAEPATPTNSATRVPLPADATAAEVIWSDATLQDTLALFPDLDAVVDLIADGLAIGA